MPAAALYALPDALPSPSHCDGVGRSRSHLHDPQHLDAACGHVLQSLHHPWAPRSSAGSLPIAVQMCSRNLQAAHEGARGCQL